MTLAARELLKLMAEIKLLKMRLAEVDRSYEQQASHIDKLQGNCRQAAAELALAKQDGNGKDALLKDARELCRFIEKNAEIGKHYPKTPGGLACFSIYDAMTPLLAKLDALK